MLLYSEVWQKGGEGITTFYGVESFYGDLEHNSCSLLEGFPKLLQEHLKNLPLLRIG